MTGGHLQSYCKNCRSLDTQLRYRSLPPKEAWARWTHSRLLIRARDSGYPFHLDWAYLAQIAPDKCPALHIPLIYERGIKGKGATDNSPSVDRYIPSLGYVRSNIAVISQLANRIKTSATLYQVQKVAQWMREQQKEN